MLFFIIKYGIFHTWCLIRTAKILAKNPEYFIWDFQINQKILHDMKINKSLSYLLYIAPLQYIDEQNTEKYWPNLLGENSEGFVCNQYYPITDSAAKNIFALPVREQQSPLCPGKGGTAACWGKHLHQWQAVMRTDHRLWPPLLWQNSRLSWRELSSLQDIFCVPAGGPQNSCVARLVRSEVWGGFVLVDRLG